MWFCLLYLAPCCALLPLLCLLLLVLVLVLRERKPHPPGCPSSLTKMRSLPRCCRQSLSAQ
jgi:hypothetical protein